MNSPAPLAHKAIHVLISGRVQGVGYRAWTEKTARKLGLSGWVRNLASGDVEAVFSGEVGTVEMMLRYCHKGSIASKATKIIVEEWNESVEQGFVRRPTASTV
jgi:acylphosphatase